MGIRTFVLLLALTPICALASDANEDPCEGDSHLSEVQCLNKNIASTERELDQVFEKLLGQTPDVDPTDNRRGRAQLRKAQKAWRQYRDENCAYVGGMEGGSNLWVTHFASICEMDETKKRIEFLRQYLTENH